MYYSVTQYEHNDYVLSIDNGFMTLMQNEKLLYAGMARYINSAVFNGRHMIFTKQDSPNLFISDFSGESVREITLSSITSVVKLFGKDFKYLAFNDCNRRICVYDLPRMEMLFEVPLKNEFLDISCTEDGIFTAIGENQEWDDMEDEWVYEMIRRFTYSSTEGIKTYSAAYARVFMDTFRDTVIDTYASYKGGIKLPLFDRYFKDWPRYKKVTPHFAIHYCSDIESMIVSSLENGNVICIFRLPDGIRSSDCLSFNEESFVLTVIESKNKRIVRYQVVPEDAAALEEMNIMYNRAYITKTWIRQNDKFNKLVFAVRDGCKITRLK